MNDKTEFSIKDYIPVIIMGVCIIAAAIFIFVNGISINDISRFITENEKQAIVIIIGLFALKGVCAVIWYSGLVAASGFAFGFSGGIIVNSIGTLICLSVSYIMGYFTKANPINSIAKKNKKIAKYVDKCTSSSFLVSYLLHAMGLSTEALGMIFGFMKMPYFKYLFSSFIAMLPTMICITVFGGEPSLTSPAFWIAVGIKVIVFAAAYFKNHKLAVEH